VLKGVEKGDIKLGKIDGKTFFKEILLKNMQQGFFADPIYGGNRDMVGWKMIGFPGARYNYLDWIDRHNERYPLPPVSMSGRAEWNVKKS
jgi:gluconate 2-dehydrogenase gamma chain